MVLQESDMFMDALTASTKSKEQRKRKRRISITKDGSSEAKKQEITTAENRESTPPPASPSNPEDKSPVAIKPNFKVIKCVIYGYSKIYRTYFQDIFFFNKEKNDSKLNNISV